MVLLDLVVDLNLLIFGRDGITKEKQEEYRCNFRSRDAICRAGYYHGYTTYQGMKIYDDVLKNKVLVVSHEIFLFRYSMRCLLY